VGSRGYPPPAAATKSAEPLGHDAACFLLERVNDKSTWYSAKVPDRVFLVADLFDVLAEPTRRDLLQLLRERADGHLQGAESDAHSNEMSVGEMVESLGITQPTVSKHLKVLREHGLVHVREDGQHRYYSLVPEPLRDVDDWLQVIAPGHAATQPSFRPDMPYVDLWPAGYQIGTAVGQLRRQLDGLLGRF
jgi:ArsR family transcriptional regulator